jgi:hypothetical protein
MSGSGDFHNPDEKLLPFMTANVRFATEKPAAP